MASAHERRQQHDLAEYRLRLQKIDLFSLHDSTLFRMSGLLQIQLKADKESNVRNSSLFLLPLLSHYDGGDNDNHTNRTASSASFWPYTHLSHTPS